MEYQSEIHKLLKLGDHPVLSSVSGPLRSRESEASAPEGLPIVMPEVHPEAQDEKPQAHESFVQIGQPAKLKSLFIYPAIFIVAFIFFYVVLNFSSIMAQIQGAFSKPQDEQILGDSLTEYYNWINNYYYAVGDKKLLDPNNDLDKDGLANMDEFIMRTNPIVADSDADGFSDGIEIINSMNPWGSGAFTSSQRELAKALDVIVVNNRVSYNASDKIGGIVSGTNTTNYDLNKPGRISIPKLNLSVDLIWSKDPAEFETGLSQGVIHYPGTALPGEQGIIYVSGHSSDYLWKKNPYSDVFARLNFLKAGDDIFVDVYGVDGKVYNYRYQVTGSATYKPDDQTQFIDNSAKKLNLSTCWPIGTQTNRLVVSAVEVGL